MKLVDTIRFSTSALNRHRIRTVLILIAMAIGVSAIVILTSLGEAARRYVIGEFASLGTNLIIVLPGRSETTGAAPTMFIGETPRDLTLRDAEALTRQHMVRYVAPVVIGEASVSYQNLERSAPVLGSTHELLQLRHWQMAKGKFLPPAEMDRAQSVAVIGAKIKQEIFKNEPALGEWLRIGDRRYRIIGILATEGRSIGMDVQDLVIIPAASAMALFNTPSLFRILVEATDREYIPDVLQWVENTLASRHQGEKDVTVITQDAVLSTFDKILQALTFTVGGIATISLAVAGILIMNVMLVSVSQRTSEIGLLKALGAPRRDIVRLFLAEAALLSSAGAALGIAFGWLVNSILQHIYPSLPLGAPAWAVAMAIIVSILTGLLFGALPARRASRLDPVLALAHK